MKSKSKNILSVLLILLIFAAVMLFSTAGDRLEYTAFAHSGALSAPEITSVSNTETGVQIEWKKADGAEKYRVFYKNGLGFWVNLDDTEFPSYTWAGAKSGKTYTFTVRCISADGKSYTSTYDREGMSITYFAAPKLLSVTNTADGVQIKWGRVNGAAKYRIFYKTASGDWRKIADTPFTNYTWTGPQSGTGYTFTVRCISANGEDFTSDFDPEGMSLTYVAVPKITSVANTSTGVQIKWDRVDGAKKYRISYKNSEGGWTDIADTILTSFIWKEAAADTKYTFTVRSIASDGCVSAYDTVGKTIICSPSLNSRASIAADAYSSCTRYVYGESAMGSQLEAYIISGNGRNDKIIFMDFAVHGCEDEFVNDGNVLVALGNGLVEYYAAHPELLGDYKLVIVPCANPDGTMHGENNYRADAEEGESAFGRCTYDGIDINRDFKADGFKAVESIALRNLMNRYTPSIYLNFHGWEDSVLGEPQLVSIFRSAVGLTTDKSNVFGTEKGYIIGYVSTTYGAQAALVEFKNSESVDQTAVITAINNVIAY